MADDDKRTPHTRTVSVATRSGRVEVPAKATQGEWAVHKPVVPERRYDGTLWTDDERAELGRGWTITHAPTGYRAQVTNTLDDAIRALRALAPVKLRDLDDLTGLDEVRRALGMPVPTPPSRKPPRRRHPAKRRMER